MDPQHELGRMLLRKAADDLSMARRLADDPDSPDWGIGFHIQQAVEKGIKAVLCTKGIEYPRTHNISALLDILADNGITMTIDRESLIVLTPYGVIFRYDEMGPTDEDLAELPDRAALLTVAEALVDWAGRLLPD
jgi:HEPN domain-containing protein